ncbi:MAG TPA: hypothetical protein VGA95_01085 [Thermodesulfobacteriota bacterium]
MYREGSREGILLTEKGAKAQEAVELNEPEPREEGVHTPSYPISSLHPTSTTKEITPIKRPLLLNRYNYFAV